jgi:glycosyltransferase involved in cell wall biosynthesis
MKIAQITCVYPPYKGGIATSAENIARVFKFAGQEVITFTLKSPLSRVVADVSAMARARAEGRGILAGDSGERVVRLKAFPGSGNGGVLPFICWRLKDFDLVYLHYPFFGTAEAVWFLKKFVWQKKKKLVIQYHMEAVLPNLFLKILSLPAALVFNSLFKNADLIVSASLDYIKNSRLKDIYAKYPEKFVEIPFGVDTERFKPACHCEERLATKQPRGFMTTGDCFSRRGGIATTILFVGGLDKAHYFKGVDILLDALNLLNKENTNWHLEIVGDGDLRPQYEKKARELGIDDKVKFAGYVSDEDMPKKYQAADYFVLPSVNKGEAFGIVLLEAMASGLPVVASDLPGVRGVFTSESGLLIKPGDAEDLAEKIKYLMVNPAKRKEMGTAARREAEEKYSAEKIAGRLISELVN